MPDGRAAKPNGRITGVDGILLTVVTFPDGSSTLMKFVNNSWQYVTRKGERTATGNVMLYPGLYDANRSGDVAFYYGGPNFTSEVAVKKGADWYAIHSMGELTPDGELLVAMNQVLINDDGIVYVLAVNDQGQQVIYRASPIQ